MSNFSTYTTSPESQKSHCKVQSPSEHEPVPKSPSSSLAKTDSYILPYTMIGGVMNSIMKVTGIYLLGVPVLIAGGVFVVVAWAKTLK